MAQLSFLVKLGAMPQEEEIEQGECVSPLASMVMRSLHFLKDKKVSLFKNSNCLIFQMIFRYKVYENQGWYYGYSPPTPHDLFPGEHGGSGENIEEESVLSPLSRSKLS